MRVAVISLFVAFLALAVWQTRSSVLAAPTSSPQDVTQQNPQAPQQNPQAPQQNAPPQQNPQAPQQNAPPQQNQAPQQPQQFPQQQQQQTPQQNQAPARRVSAEDVRVEPVDQGGRKGWRVTFPGGRPVATPAWADGVLYVGGGFGSHEFYALDAVSGKVAWVYRTDDDGPTAAVCADGLIAFNTESCELEIITPEGKRLWKKWLGDPLMSMPAIDGGRVYMAYPHSRGDRKHHLACFDLKSGKEMWKQPIAGEVITSPVISGGRVYATTLGGVVYCFEADAGRLVWTGERKATSSPAVSRGQCYYSQRQAVVTRKDGAEKTQQNEQIANAGGAGNETVMTSTAAPADYLDYGKKQSGAQERTKQSHDASVGFGGSKGDAKIDQAQSNLGEGSVYGVWSYQGSRPFIHKNRLYSAMGSTLRCVDLPSGKIVWNRSVKGDATERQLTPPAIANGKLFVGTAQGTLLCLSQATGETLWSVEVGEPIWFQPAVVAGRVYVPSSKGHLYCFETGDPQDDGWRMWGGDARHNGTL